MKANLSRMLRSGIAMLLVLCMAVGFVPSVAFANAGAENDILNTLDKDGDGEINYVSLGASNANGYGLHGYLPDGITVADKATANVYGFGRDVEGSYGDLVRDYLESQGATVNWNPMAISSMRAEELRVLLDNDFYGDAYTEWRFYKVENNVESGWFVNAAGSLEATRQAYQEGIKNADLITVDIGINNFGVYVSNAIRGMYTWDLNTVDPELAGYYEQAKDYVMGLLADSMPAGMAGMTGTLEQLADVMAYTMVGFCTSFDASMKKIYELNPDATVVVVSIQNLMEGMNVSIPGLNETLALDKLFGTAISAANLYTATMSPYANKYFYANASVNGRVEFFVDQIINYNGDPSTLFEAGRDPLSGDMTDCFDIYDDDLLVKPRVQLALYEQVTGYPWLEQWPDESDRDYEARLVASIGDLNAYFEANVVNDATFGPIYASILTAVYDACAQLMQYGAKVDTLSLGALAADKQTWGQIENGLLSVIFGEFERAMEESYIAVTSGEPYKFTLTENIFEDTAATAGIPLELMYTVLSMGVRTSIGNSFYGHPNRNGHKQLADIIINTLENATTGKEVVGGEVVAVAKKIWTMWMNRYGADVEVTIEKLTNLVTERYEYYTQTTLPALENEISQLLAQKETLVNELNTLNQQLAAKKAELEEVLAKQEIGSVSTPDINIGVDFGNNATTTVPGNDCNVEGTTAKEELEAAIADLEHAIAVLSALITDMTGDIDKMVELAGQVADAVKSLGKTLSEIAAAAEDVKDAFEAVKEVMTNDSAVAAGNQFVTAFTAARAAVAQAAKVLDMAADTAGMLIGDIDELLDIVIADGEALYNKMIADLPLVMEKLPAEVKLVLAAALKVANDQGWTMETAKNHIAYRLETIKAEFAPEIAEAEAKLEALKNEIAIEIATRYTVVKAEIEAKAALTIAELEARKAALEAELKAYQEELKNQVTDAVRDQLQAQIDRVTGDLAIVNADLAHALAHLEEALKLAYDEVAADVNAKYEEALEELQKALDDLKAALEAAINKNLDELLDMGMEGLKQILTGLKDHVIVKSEELLTALVDHLVDVFNKMLYNATHGEVLVGLNFKYVALGDGSNDYAALLAEKVSGHAWGTMEFVDATKPGSTVADAAANLPTDVVGADLITLGFSQTEMIGRALAAYMAGEEVAWAELVGEENLPYVEKVLAYINAEIDAMELEEQLSTMLKGLAEAYAYGMVEYTINLPQLLVNIRKVNPTAEIVILGMYNPIKDLSFSAMDIELNMSDYAELTEIFDYLLDGVYAYGVGLSVIIPDVTYVDAREVEIAKSQLGLSDLEKLLGGDISALYPDAESDAYIADRIYGSLVFTMKGDANGDGKVDSYDAALIARYDVGLIGAGDLNLKVCDLNGDGKVDSYDATLVARYDVGLLGA